MKKAQIQVLEEMLEKRLALAKQRECSIAAATWTPPTSSRVGWKGLTAEQLREAAFADGDPKLA